MKIVLIATLVAFTAAAKLGSSDDVEVVKDVRVPPEGGSYSTLLELSNGVKISEEGAPGAEGQTNVKGSYSFTSPEGDVVVITYTADENGFVASGDALPVAPPMPAHALEQIRFAAEETAKGIFHE